MGLRKALPASQRFATSAAATVATITRIGGLGIVGRTALLGDVVVRVSETFADAMHIDTDESNAICAAPGMFGEIIKSL